MLIFKMWRERVNEDRWLAIEERFLKLNPRTQGFRTLDGSSPPKFSWQFWPSQSEGITQADVEAFRVEARRACALLSRNVGGSLPKSWGESPEDQWATFVFKNVPIGPAATILGGGKNGKLVESLPEKCAKACALVSLNERKTLDSIRAEILLD